MKKYYIYLIMLLSIFITSMLYASTDQSLSITGVVRQPLNLTIDDLNRFQTFRVQLNEVLKDGSYRGAWFYRGVSLKTLLETAYIKKEETAFSKVIDLAILVRNREGEEVALSWGEIFYKPESNVVIATSAVPIKPHHGCSSCHEPDVSDLYMKQFDREIGFPKLVVAGDGYADRSIENVVSIEVINPAPRMPADKSVKLFSPSFVVTGNVKKEVTFNDLSGFPRKDMRVIHMGEGRGYHGIDDYSGVLFNDIVNKAGVDPGLSKIFLISAPDGYRTSFSYGEIFLNRVEDNTIIADMKNGKEIEEEGRFTLIPSDDLMLDRDIKSVQKIEVIDLASEPKVTYIGIGCGDTDLITMEAVSAIAKADILICPPDIKKRFGKYMGNKPVLFDIYDYVPPAMKKKYPDLSREALEKKIEEGRVEIAERIKRELNKGNNVAIIEYGDPTIWSGAEYIMEHISDDMIEIVPGLSSFNVANALLKEHIGCKGSIILANSKGILENKPLFRVAAEAGETISIFMGIKDLPELIKLFKKSYKPGTPVHVAYRAGYSGSEKVVKTDLDGLQDVIEREPEKNLFLIYIGPCLESERAHRH
jgi:precorrin-4 methylase